MEQDGEGYGHTISIRLRGHELDGLKQLAQRRQQSISWIIRGQVTRLLAGEAERNLMAAFMKHDHERLMRRFDRVAAMVKNI